MPKKANRSEFANPTEEIVDVVRMCTQAKRYRNVRRASLVLESGEHFDGSLGNVSERHFLSVEQRVRNTSAPTLLLG